MPGFKRSGDQLKGESRWHGIKQVEIFSVGCSACNEVVGLVKRISCPSYEVSVLDMNDQQVAQRARSLGIGSVPAAVVDGKLASCCVGRGPNAAELRAAGIRQQL
jgi:glutaredoxin 3